MTVSSLDVWLHGTRVARLSEDQRGRIALEWAAEAQERWGRGVRLLSASLTLSQTPPPPLVKAYLDGLLPEGNARVNYAMAAGLVSQDTFALIREYGRDTPGAAIFVPAGHPDPTREGSYEPLTVADVADRLRGADRYQRAAGGTTESSTLPGMVPKITVHREGDRWFSCHGGAASTWILKRAAEPGSEAADVVDTEAASLAIARRLGLTTVEAEVVDFGDVRAIAVSRYDRTDHGRLHQEDLAQAIGLSTADPHRKFQWGAAMPSLGHAAEVLRTDGGDAGQLLRQVALSFLLGNTDLHAKNISFLRHDTGQVEITPAYDIAMHLHHPREEQQRRFAMDLNGRYRMRDLTVLDVIEEGISWGLPAPRARRLVAATVAEAREAIAGLDRDEHPGVSDAAWQCVEQRVEVAAQQLPAPGSGPATGTTNGTGPAPRTAPRRGPRRPR